MWKIGAAAGVAALLLTLLAIHFWPRVPRTEVQPADGARVQPLSNAAVRRCAKKVLADWVRDGQFDADYRRVCYRAALARAFGGVRGCDALYGVSLCDDLVARLQSSS